MRLRVVGIKRKKVANKVNVSLIVGGPLKRKGQV